MHRIIVSIFALLMSLGLFSQEKELRGNLNQNSMLIEREDKAPEIKIFPVPVLEGRFTITSDTPFILVRMNNIIGQEIAREKYNYPRNRSELSFINAEKGIYLVTIEFEDHSKTVKKILVDTRQ